MGRSAVLWYTLRRLALSAFKIKNNTRSSCHFLVAKSDQKASLAKAKTHCNRLFENFLHEINSRN